MAQSSIKIISLNIEGSKHLDKVLRLIQQEKADVACLQEVFVEDFNWLKRKTGLKGLIAPAIYIAAPGRPGHQKRGPFGTGLLSSLPGEFHQTYYYHRRAGEKKQGLPVYQGRPNSGHRPLVWQTARINHQPLTLTTTHFTWSFAGKTTNRQRRDLKKLFNLLDEIKPDLLCGDFNAPRGQEIFSKLSQRFKDNLPPSVTSTLDPKLHLVGHLNLVVDGFFTRPKLRVEKIRLVSGVSDHLAIVGSVKIET